MDAETYGANIRSLKARLDTLTKREVQVVRLIMDGMTDVEIGNRLRISPRTVQLHRAHAVSKMAANNTPHMVRLYIEGTTGVVLE